MAGPGRNAPQVRTSAGRLSGIREREVNVYRGIPFAAPPVGERRFAAPRPASRWDGVRPAAAYGPRPPQPTLFGASRPDEGDDWLTLNVWTADPDPLARLPVMMWIPGGAYVIGDGGLPEYDGGHLARGGVVVVTMNYRLGVEGFAQIEGAPANRGLLDQVAALEWIRENIGAFGGDPDRVTVFGQSAGAGSIAALMAMPRAAGLFGRAITQSVTGILLTPELAADVAAAVAAELGLRATVADLAAVDPGRLLAAAVAVSASMVRRRDRWGRIAHRPVPFAPVVDGEVLPASPWQARAGRLGRDVDLLAGHTRDEHRLFSLIDGVLGQVSAEQAETALRMLAPEPAGARGYRGAFPSATDEELYELVNGDWVFRMPSLHLAEAHVAGGGRAHLYELTWAAPGMGGGLGACHGLDIPLVFGNLTAGNAGGLIGEPVPTIATELLGQMQQAWIAFAGGGDPGWPGYDSERRLTRVFDGSATVTTYPEDASRLLWQDHEFGALPLLVR